MQNEIHLNTAKYCPFKEQQFERRECDLFNCSLYVSSSGRCSFKDIAHTLKEMLGATVEEKQKPLSPEAYQRLMKLGE